MVNTVTQTLAQKPVSRATQLSAFAEALGSREGVDPIPPSQYLYFLDRKQPALQRLLAWVRSKTIRYREQRNGGDGRRAWCVDSRGKELHLADLARELGWHKSNATREWKAAERLGLVRKEGKRLLLVGDVPAPELNGAGEKSYLYRQLPHSVVKIIESWPPPRQAEFNAVWQPALKLSESLQARHMAEARNTATRMYDTIFAHFGLPKKHLKPAAAPPPIEVPEQLNLFVKLAPFGSVRITSSNDRTDNGNAPRADNRILMSQSTHRMIRENGTPSSTTASVEPPKSETGTDFLNEVRTAAGEAGVVLRDADAATALDWQTRGFTALVARRAIFLGTFRQLSSALSNKTKPGVHSLKYFAAILQEVNDTEVEPEYWDYVEKRVKHEREKLACSSASACD